MADAGRRQTTYTADEITAGIGAALRAGDMPAVAGLIRLLAVRDPDAAEAIMLAVDVVSADASGQS